MSASNTAGLLGHLSVDDFITSAGKGAFWRGFATAEHSWTKFTIPKKDGTRRDIYEPSKWGKIVGNIVAKAIFADEDFETYQEVGFRPGTGTPVALGVIGYARDVHEMDTLSVDIRRAFEALTAKQVYELCVDHGASSEVARIIVRATCQGGRLRMGATGSPAVFSLAMARVCADLEDNLMWVSGTVAYADDLTIFTTPETYPGTKKALRDLKRSFWRVMRFKLSRPKSFFTPHRAELTTLGSVHRPGRGWNPRPAIRKKMEGMAHACKSGRADEPYASSKALNPPTVEDALRGFYAYRQSLWAPRLA